MYRINISKTEDDNGVTYRIRHKGTGLEKTARATHCAAITQPFNASSEISYQLYKKCKEIMRDLLYIDAGDHYRLYEARHATQINKSIMRAVKFAK